MHISISQEAEYTPGDRTKPDTLSEAVKLQVEETEDELENPNTLILWVEVGDITADPSEEEIRSYQGGR